MRISAKAVGIIGAAAVICILVAIGVMFPRSISTQGKTALDITDRVDVPIFVYHLISSDNSLLGEYCISPSELENDLIYFHQRGYTPVQIIDLVNYCYKDTPLPERPIVLSFDVGYASGYESVYPLLQKYQAKAVFAIVGAYTDEASEKSRSVQPAFLRWWELRDMVESGLIEIANQSYDMNYYNDSERRGTARTSGETPAEYGDALYADIIRLQEEVCDKVGVIPTVFCYPYGIMDRPTAGLLDEMGFAATLSRNNGVNYLSGDPRELYGLRRNVRMHGIPTEDLLNEIYRVRVV